MKAIRSWKERVGEQRVEEVFKDPAARGLNYIHLERGFFNGDVIPKRVVGKEKSYAQRLVDENLCLACTGTKIDTTGERLQVVRNGEMYEEPATCKACKGTGKRTKEQSEMMK
jgi:hypothetical protein